MDVACPECGEPLDAIDHADDMGSRARRFRCLECCIVFETDPSGLLREVEG